MEVIRLQHLFNLYYKKTATAEEKAELMLLVRTASPQDLAAMIVEEGQGLLIEDLEIPPARAAQMLQSILGPEPAVLKIPPTGTVAQSPAISKQTWLRYAVAAAVIFLLGFAGWFLTLKKEPVRTN